MKRKPLVDTYGRSHDYLRISVTDRCNLRCVYCKPEEDVRCLEPDQVLRYEEIEEVVRVAASMGIKRIRLTGGEPLVRKGIETLVKRIAAIPEIEDIALTTNGILLADKAEGLKRAGLSRVNISLDSCKPDRYEMVTRGGDLQKVLHAIDKSLEVGFDPVKLNVVLIKGFNDDEIDDFLAMTLHRRIHVRFIEYMPIGGATEQWKARYQPLDKVLERAEVFGLSKEQIWGSGPSENYKLHNAKGSFGLIHPVSQHFCGHCNRLRLTANGMLKPCLYWNDECHVRPLIGNPDGIKQLLIKALALKPQQHEMGNEYVGQASHSLPTTRSMYQIGG